MFEVWCFLLPVISRGGLYGSTYSDLAMQNIYDVF